MYFLLALQFPSSVPNAYSSNMLHSKKQHHRNRNHWNTHTTASHDPIQDAIKWHLCRKGYWDVNKYRQLRNCWSWGLSIGTADGLFPSDCFIMGDGEVLRMLRQEWNVTKQLLIISLMLRWVLQKLPGIAWWHREAFKVQALLTCTLRC